MCILIFKYDVPLCDKENHNNDPTFRPVEGTYVCNRLSSCIIDSILIDGFKNDANFAGDFTDSPTSQIVAWKEMQSA